MAIVALLAVPVSLFVAIRDPIVQTFVARSAATYLSRELGTTVTVGRFFLGLDLSIRIKDLTINDKEGQTLLAADFIDLSVDSRNIFKRIQLNNIELDGFDFQLMKYQGEDELNFQFILDYFVSDAKENNTGQTVEISVKKIILNKGSFRYRDYDNELEDSEGIDYAHIRAENIHLNASEIEIINDSIRIDINSFSATEKSGLVIQKMKGLMAIGNKSFLSENLHIETPKSSLNLKLNFRYDHYKAYLNFIDSVHIEADVAPSNLFMADMGYFAPIMFQMPNNITFSGKISGNVSDFVAKNFSFSFKDQTTFLGMIAMKGLPDFYSTDISLRFSRLTTSVDDVKQFAIPTTEQFIQIPENFPLLGLLDISGMFSGKYNDFIARTNISTNSGQIQSDLALRNNPRTGITTYRGQLVTKSLNIGKIIDNENVVGKLDMNVKIDGHGLTLETAQMNLSGKISSIDLLHNTFRDIMLTGDLTSQTFNGNFSVEDSKLKLDFVGLANLTEEQPVFDFAVNIEHSDIAKLSISSLDSIMIFSGLFNAKFTGLNIDDFVGTIDGKNLRYIDSRGVYKLNNFQISMTDDPILNRKINITSDILDFELGGLIAFTTIEESFRQFVTHFIAFESFSPREIIADEQDFYFNLKLKETEMLSQLLTPNLKVAENLSFSGVYTSKRNLLNATLSCDYIYINDLKIMKPYLLIQSNADEAIVDLEMNNLTYGNLTENDSITYGIENPGLLFTVKNDSLLFNIGWNNNDILLRNRGDVGGYYRLDSIKSGILHVDKANVVINDSALSIRNENVVYFTKEYTRIENFEFVIGNSSLALEGNIPVTENDSLSFVFSNWNISNLDIIIRSFGFDLDGIINGDLVLANLKYHPALVSNLHIDGLHLNKELLGDARLVSSWSNIDESIYVNAQIINKGDVGSSRMLNLTGFYYPNENKENLRFDLSLENFRLKVINQFVEGILSHIEGLASGEFSITGELKKPVVKGKLNLLRSAFNIDYLNTSYSLQHEFNIEPGIIHIDNLILYDTLGNKAVVNGKITHNYLRDYNFDISIKPDRFIALNTGPFDNELFYGTAAVSGDVFIRGPLEKIEMNIRAVSQKGTNIVIPLNTTGSIGSNDYITFVDSFSTDVNDENGKPFIPKISNGFEINLETVVTPDATLKIFLPYNIGNLDASGSGNITMDVNDAGDFSLNGDYVVQNGQFTFSFENLLKKRFDLVEGGRISWTGDPYDAEIDVKGLYRVKASLGGLGIDTTSSLRSRVNVDCIIHLSQELFNPEIKFSIQLPGIDPELEQRVFSVIDTTNDAMMTQQMISLLVLGSFGYTGSNAFSISNSSLNMLTGQLSGLLSQISKDFDIGVQYRPGDNLTNEELEVALSTQLFNDRVSIDGNFGVINNRSTAQNVSNIVGDVDISVKITPDGRLRLKAFNHSNYNTWLNSSAFDNYSPFTQGIGVSYRQEFDQFGELFRRKKTKTIK